MAQVVALQAAGRVSEEVDVRELLEVLKCGIYPWGRQSVRSLSRRGEVVRCLVFLERALAAHLEGRQSPRISQFLGVVSFRRIRLNRSW